MLEPSNTNMQHTLTRYLYPKELVKASLVWAIIDQKVDETLFWGYELYYSGFRAETFDLIISIYVMYFKEKYPRMKPYLCRQLEKWYSQEENTTKKFISHDTIIGSILRNMASRPVSLTTILRFRIGIVPEGSPDNDPEEFDDSVEEDENSYVRRTGEFRRDVGISDRMSQQLSPGVQSTPRTLDEVETSTLLLPDLTPSEIKQYKTNYEIPSSKTIRNVAIFPIRTQYFNISDEVSNETHSYNVFELSTRVFEKPNSMDQFSYQDWLYHASGSPIWKNRILLHEGEIRHDTQQVIFIDEEQEEQFYNKYDYEIDEQPSELRDKLFGKRVECDSYNFISWESLYKKYGSYSLFTKINITPLKNTIRLNSNLHGCKRM